MDILQKIIGLMSKEEQRNYTLLAERWRATDDRKDLELFRYFRKTGEKANERKIMRELYGAKGENAYYRLKNRLFTEVTRSLSLLHWDHNSLFLTLHYLEMALLYRDRQEYEVALHFLKRAEKKAGEIEKLELLEIIYSEFIGLSFALQEIDPAHYISLQEENGRRLAQLRKIDHILAVASYRIRKTQNLSGGDHTLIALLETTVEEFSDDPDLWASPQFRFRMYEAVSKLLLQRHDYVALEEYMRTTYNDFEKENLFNRENHETRLQMLTYLVNSLFKNDKLQEALSYAGILKNELEKFSRMHTEKYQFFYHSSLATIYYKLDPDRAIRILEDLLEDEKLSRLPMYQMLIYPNLAICYYEKKNYKKTIQNLVKLNIQEAFVSADPSLKLKISVFEMAVRYLQNEPETLEYRVNQTRKDFADLLAQPDYAKESAMLQLIQHMNQSEDAVNEEKVIAEARQFLANYGPSDNDPLQYHVWITDRFGF